MVERIFSNILINVIANLIANLIVEIFKFIKRERSRVSGQGNDISDSFSENE